MRIKDLTLKDAIWQGFLTLVKGIKDLPNESREGTRSAIEEYSEEDGLHVAKMYYEEQNPDGTSTRYDVEIRVTERVHHNDDYWGAGFDPAREVIVNNVHYMLGTTGGPNSMRGFGGRRWRIQFHDGRLIETTDLWYQGTIPPKWRERYPDNAIFL